MYDHYGPFAHPYTVMAGYGPLLSEVDYAH